MPQKQWLKMITGRYSDRQNIRRWGRNITWYPSLWAAARRNQQPDRYSGTSSGDITGVEYATAVTMRALVFNNDVDHTFEVEGAWNKGRCFCTVPAHRDVAEEDKIVLTDFEVGSNAVLTRGAIADGKDELRQTIVTELLELEDQDDVTYTVGTDFKLTLSAGVYYVDWDVSGGSEPAAAKTYSVNMKLRPAWKVDGVPMIRGKGIGRRMIRPKKCELVRFNEGVAN